MRSSFLGLEVSKRTIQLSQKALDITGSNISNSKTEGYTRQAVDVASSYFYEYSNWQTPTSRMTLAGQGAIGLGVDQVRDPYIDKRYRESACYVAQYATTRDVMKEVESVLDNIMNDGLATSLDTIKDALSKYAERPDNEELASIVRNQCFNLTNQLRSYQARFDELKESNLESLDATIEDTNVIIDEIVSYNKAIVKEYSVMAAGKQARGESVTAGYGPNEMLDARNLLLDELSCKLNINVYDNADGSVRVVTKNEDGKEIELINGEKYEHLYMKQSTKNVSEESSTLLRDYKAYGAAVLMWTSGERASTQSGELRAYDDILNGNGVYQTGYQNKSYGIPYYESTIDTFIDTFGSFMNRFNGAIDDEGRVIDESRLLFCTEDYYEGRKTYEEVDMTARNVKIAKSWMSNATMIGEQLNEKGEWKLSLDGNHINQMIEAIDKRSLEFGDKGDFEGTTYDYLLFVFNRIGQNIKYNNSQYEASFDTANAILDSRDAVSGVSETEEGINMLTYQNWYNASARMMTALDDALDRLINNTGRVGL